MSVLRRLGLGTLVAVLLGVVPAQAQLPDLVSDPPEDPFLATYVAGGMPSLLLRFDSFVHNAGPGPLELLASIPADLPPVSPQTNRGTPAPQATSVQQQVAGGGLQTMPGANVFFDDGRLDNEDAHNHYHLQRAAEYSLRTANGAALVAPAAKVGFCLLDSQRMSGTTPRRYDDFCRSDNRPDAGALTMGVSAGWRDIYGASLANQWVDVSWTSPGTYALHSEVDPDDVVDEVGEVGTADKNALSAGVPVRIPGYLAKPRIAPTGASTVLLAADGVAPFDGELAPPRFRITAGPTNGTIDRPLNTWLTDPIVHYTPNDPASPAPDELTYLALAQDSNFPRTPPTAKVTFGGGTRVAISGAPQEILAGTTVQLAAPGATTWSATAGTVRDGTFTAPATAGDVTVRAANAAGSAATVTIRVVGVPEREPAPLPAGVPAGDTAAVPPRTIVPRAPAKLPRRSIAAASADRIGRFVVVSVKPGRSGRLRVVLRRNARTLTACSVRAVAGRSITCRLRRPAKGRGALRVVVQLRRLDGALVRQAVPVKAGHVH